MARRRKRNKLVDIQMGEPQELSPEATITRNVKDSIDFKTPNNKVRKTIDLRKVLTSLK